MSGIAGIAGIGGSGIYEALEGEAQNHAAAYFESGGLRSEERPEDFIAFLDRSKWDPTRITRARGELNAIKMGPKQRWSVFFPLWANKLAEANGDGWPDETKITMLEGTLNHTARLALAGNHLLPPDNFFGWVRIVTHIAQRYEVPLNGPNPNPSHNPSSIELSTNKRYSNDNPKIEASDISSGRRARSGDRQESAHDVDSSGDTIMGGIHSAEILRGPNNKPPRAKIWQHDCFGKLGATGKVRVQEHEENISRELKMNTTPFLVNALINDVTMVQALVDNGCLCSGIIDDNLTSLLKLPRLPILPRFLETAENSRSEKPNVKNITYVFLDLDGCVTPKLWLYVVPNSTHRIILGKKWLEDQDAIIHSKEQRLNLQKNGFVIYSVKRWRQELRNVVRPRVATVDVMRDMCSEITEPLTTLTKENAAWRWGVDENRAFEKLKEVFATQPVLAQWDPERKTKVEGDNNENLKYFTSKRLLNGRQVRYNDVLQRFNFVLKWRLGSAYERPDALSRRDQDNPSSISDERTAGRVMQLLPPLEVNPATVQPKGDGIDQRVDPAALARLFDDDELQTLWKLGIESDKDWRQALDAFIPDIAYKLSANISECSVVADSVLRGRENRI
ncbi:hypothetical protein K3495_g9677 [Podosphaera aphanis]|nr:hypothetical protein K3495_g9677 [Podosphaera aphanis]